MSSQTLLGVAKYSVALNDDLFVTVFSEVCKLLNVRFLSHWSCNTADTFQVQDDDVCDGAIALEGPVIAQVIREMDIPSKTSQLLCNTLSGLCPFPDVEPLQLTFPTSKPSNSTRPRASGQTPIQIVHYSDIHIDPLYAEGSDANCNKPICCRNYADSDSGSSTFIPAGANGDHKCDTPKSLEESMYAAIREVAPEAKFALFTGDIVDHAIWSTSQEHNTDVINNAYAMMTGFGQVYGTIGNHEQHPTNVLQSNAVGNNAHWLYNLLSGIWSPWIGTSAAASTQDTGFYSSKVPGTNLRIISLNTNMYYKLNFYMYQSEMEKDPNGQLAWLLNELTDAETVGDRAYIIGHMPMGHSDAFQDGSNGFDQIVHRFSNTIAGMFFGHTHKDEFQISYSDYDDRSFSNADAFSYIMPSLTPTDGMPAFRVYDVDPVTFAVLDATTYIADMEDPAFQTSGPKWTKYYSVKETYGALLTAPPSGTDELTPAFWHNVTEVFKADDAAFGGYVSKKTRGWNVETCTGECKDETICQLQAGRSQDNCFEPDIGFGFEKSKREVRIATDAKHAGHGTTCGGSAFRDMFAAARNV
jgi:sphingomyelin phosphodiesterase